MVWPTFAVISISSTPGSCGRSRRRRPPSNTPTPLDGNHHDADAHASRFQARHILAGGVTQKELFERHTAVEAQGFGARVHRSDARLLRVHGRPEARRGIGPCVKPRARMALSTVANWHRRSGRREIDGLFEKRTSSGSGFSKTASVLRRPSVRTPSTAYSCPEIKLST